MKKKIGYLTHSGVRVGVLEQDTKTEEFFFKAKPRNFSKLKTIIPHNELQTTINAISNDIAFIKDNPTAVQSYFSKYDAAFKWKQEVNI